MFKRKLGSYAGVVNARINTIWLGSNLVMSNLYAYGNLARDPRSDSVGILVDWIRLTFGLKPSIREAIADMSMKSWPAYENYKGNLAIQFEKTATTPDSLTAWFHHVLYMFTLHSGKTVIQQFYDAHSL